MTKTITVSDIIPAAAADIYDAWLDGVAHAAMTGGGKADASPEVGAPYTAWDGYINGLNLALNPGERIEQSWRSTDFTPGDADSTLTVLLEPADAGTKVTLIHTGVPDQLADFAEGWRQYYFEPMKSYFAALMEPPMAGASAPMSVSAPRATKKPAARKAAAKKPAAKKPAARTAAVKKPAAKKPAAKKAAASKKPTPAKRAATKKPAGRRTASARSAAKKKPPARKVAARKVAKKSSTRKPAARKPAKKPARRGRG